MNARRIARKVIAESDGARREREIDELEQQFDAPAHEKDEGDHQEDYGRADKAFTEALESVSGILGDSQLGAVMKLAIENANDDKLVAQFCYNLAGETSGDTSGWFAALAEALEQQDRTGEAYSRASERMHNRSKPE